MSRTPKNIIYINKLEVEVLRDFKPQNIHIEIKIKEEPYKLISKKYIKMKSLFPHIDSRIKFEDVQKEFGGCLYHTFQIDIEKCTTWKDAILTLFMLCYLCGLDTEKELEDFKAYMIRHQKDGHRRNVRLNLSDNWENGWDKVPTLKANKKLYVNMEHNPFAYKEYLIKMIRWLKADEKTSYILIDNTTASDKELFGASNVSMDTIQHTEKSIREYNDSLERWKDFWIRELYAIKSDLEKSGEINTEEYSCVSEAYAKMRKDIFDNLFYDEDIIVKAPTLEEYEQMEYGKLHLVFPSYNKGVGIFSLREKSQYLHHILITENVTIQADEVKELNGERETISNYFYVAFPINENTYQDLYMRYPAFMEDILNVIREGREEYIVTDVEYMGKFY